MSNVAKLKKKALELEQKKQFDKAVAVYVELLESFDEHADELDVALFNRVGDLLMRQGNVADAMDYYERAVDHYSEGGFFNNAIALCNKILRQSPGRTSIYYKLGKISAKKGFKGDAKQNFLEYADRMQKGGNLDEAFRALKEFADLCPDQDDIRQMLADQLLKQGRKEEALEQLQLLHERYELEGRDGEAQATRKRLKSIDPSIEPRVGGEKSVAAAGDLVFLDLDAPSPPRNTPYAGSGTVSAPPPMGKAPPKFTSSSATLPFISLDPSPAPPAPVVPPKPAPKAPRPAEPPPVSANLDDSATVGSALPEPDTEDVLDPSLTAELDFTSLPAVEESAELEGITRLEDFGVGANSLLPDSMLGLEPTNFGEIENSDSASGSLLDLEPTSFGSGFEAAREDEALLDPVEWSAPNPPTSANLGSPSAPSGRESPEAAAELDFILPDETPTAAEAKSSHDILEELEPPLTRQPQPEQRPPRGFVGRKKAKPEPKQDPATAGLPLMDLDTPAPSAKGRPAEPLIPSLTLDDAFVERLENANGDAAAAREAATWTAPASSGSYGTVDPDEELDAGTAAPRESTMIAAQSVEMLEAAVASEPGNWSLRRQLAEAMLDSGNRLGGLRELEAAMLGAERANDLHHAGTIAEEIARIDPGTIRHHQKRVEYAFRTNDKPHLIEAYIALAEALLRTEQGEKARAVYQRVLDLAPDDIRAQAAIESYEQMEAAAAARRAARAEGRSAPTPIRAHGSVQARPTPSSPDFVNLGDWLRETEAPKDTRMVVPEHEPTGDEEADFQDMLRRFKQGIAENVDDADHQAHYDLGVAFKEMGLLDEAIAEFQKALRSPTNRVPTYEALGQCFMEKSQYPMAFTVLSRALHENGMSDDQLVGVLYLLGRATEAMSRRDEALAFYQRVFVVDIQFRDVAERLAEVERAAG
jgi:tetratricopeptide (TPR) repeat protein